MNSTPRHVAIIMDRNGEWAKRRMLARAAGHTAGAEAVKRAVKGAVNHKLEVLSLYTFSTENWLRPADEVSFLMSLLEKFILRESEEFMRRDIKLLVSGRLDRLPVSTGKAVGRVIEKTAGNNGLILNIALDYGGRDEILHAVRSIVQEGKSAADITERDIQNHLYQPALPDVDLLIRTGGEQRISNFLLWQSAYAELYFPEVFWPDFTENDLSEALKVFATRVRRFGRTDEQIKQDYNL